jgi:hypothetical protein
MSRSFAGFASLLFVAHLSMGCGDSATSASPDESPTDPAGEAAEAPSEGSAEAPSEGAEDPEAAAEVPVEVLSTELEVVETDGIFANVVYTVTLKNHSTERFVARLDVRFLDEQDQEVGEAAWFNRTVDAGAEKTFSQDALAPDSARSVQVRVSKF